MVTPLNRIIRDRIAADAAILALLPGGVHDRLIRRNVSSGPVPTPGSTPEAFDPITGELRLCCAVMNGPDGDDPNPRAPPSAHRVLPTCWFHVPDRPDARNQFEQVWELCRALFDRTVLTDGFGRPLEVHVAGRLGIADDPDFAGAVIDTLRLRATGLWRT